MDGIKQSHLKRYRLHKWLTNDEYHSVGDRHTECDRNRYAVTESYANSVFNAVYDAKCFADAKWDLDSDGDAISQCNVDCVRCAEPKFNAELDRSSNSLRHAQWQPDADYECIPERITGADTQLNDHVHRHANPVSKRFTDDDLQCDWLTQRLSQRLERANAERHAVRKRDVDCESSVDAYRYRDPDADAVFFASAELQLDTDSERYPHGVRHADSQSSAVPLDDPERIIDSDCKHDAECERFCHSVAHGDAHNDAEPIPDSHPFQHREP